MQGGGWSARVSGRAQPGGENEVVSLIFYAGAEDNDGDLKLHGGKKKVPKKRTKKKN